MGLFSMSGKKKKGYYGGSSSYGKPGLGGLGGMMGMFGSFSSSVRKRQMYQQQMAQQQAAIHQNPVVQQTPQAAPAAAISAQASSGSIACPACGASVPAGSKFCLECGNKNRRRFLRRVRCRVASRCEILSRMRNPARMTKRLPYAFSLEARNLD